MHVCKIKAASLKADLVRNYDTVTENELHTYDINKSAIDPIAL